MRFSRLHLARFGRFTDKTLDLPPSRPDLHIVLGPNEAGKSTARVALSDLLFGIEAQTPFNFLHEHKAMRLGAEVEEGERRLAFRRRKGNKNTLLDEGEEALPDAVLLPFLHGADRTFFERMFSLDQSRLVEGGRQLLAADDDLGRMLFQASGGLAHLGEVRGALEKEADDLWAPRRSGSRAYYADEARLGEAEVALKQATVRAKDFRDAQKKVADAERAAEEAAAERKVLAGLRARLARVKRVAPSVDRRRGLRAELESLAHVPLLPEGATTLIEGATTELASIKRELERLDTDGATARGQRDARPVDEAVLALADELADAEAEGHAVKNHADDLAKRRAVVQELTNQAEALAAALGWPPGPPPTLALRLPSELAREGFAAHMERHVRVLAELASATEALATLVAQREDLAREKEPTGDEGAPAALREALEAARTLGDTERRDRDLAATLEAAEKKERAARGALAPWVGDVEGLRALALPTDEDLEILAQRLQRATQSRDKARDAHADATAKLERLRLQEGQVRRDERPVTAEELAASRGTRDARWRNLRSAVVGGEGPPGPRLPSEVEAFESSVRTADGLADDRFTAANASANLQRIRAEIEATELDEKAGADRIRRAEEDLVGAQQALVALQCDLGLTYDSVPKVRAWAARRGAALEAATAAERAREAVAQHQREKDGAAAKLRDALAAAGAKVPGAEAAPLGALIAKAADLVRTRDASHTRQQELAKQLAKLDRALPDLDARRKQAATALEEWRGAYARHLLAFGLQEDTDPAVARKALGLLRDLGDKLREADNIERTRIATMVRDLDRFASRVGRIAHALGMELQDRKPADVLKDLLTRLGEAKENRRLRDEAARALKRTEEDLESARGRKQAAEVKLDPLFQAAGTTDLAALHAAVLQSNRRRDVERDLHTIERSLVEAADGLSLEALEAEVDAQDRALLDGDLERASMSAEALAERQQRLAVDLTDARRAFDQMTGQADAAAAAARRNEALAGMTDTMERYVRVRMATELLRWAMDRFRKEKQGPLLARASELFCTLTLGELERLVVEYDEKDKPQLEGLRRSGETVPIGGMSTGTRDQLFLALRIAALEAHLAVSPALPFIADDLFVHFDDTRAAAAFKVLAELSTRTQVLFFTHHEHLVRVAKGVLGEGVRVVRIG